MKTVLCTTYNLLVLFTACLMDNISAMSHVVGFFLPYDAKHFSTAVLISIEDATKNFEKDFRSC